MARRQTTESTEEVRPVVDRDFRRTQKLIQSYRRLTKDVHSSDELVLERIKYLEQLCRSVIQEELKNYGKQTT